MAPKQSISIRPAIIVFITIFISWTLYRYYFAHAQWIDELVAKPIIWLTPLLLVLVVERQSMRTIGLVPYKFIKNSITGTVFGATLIGERLFTGYFRDGMIVFNPMQLSAQHMALQFPISFATAFTEEVVFRGFLQTRLVKAYGNMWLGLAVSTTGFIAIHLPLIVFIYHYSFEETLMYLILLLVLSVLNGYMFYLTKSLTTPIIIHTLWNFSSVLFR